MNLDVNERIEGVLAKKPISDFLSRYGSAEEYARNAAEWLFQHTQPEPTAEQVAMNVERLLEPLRAQKLTVFFSYKDKDNFVAQRIASWLEEWSAGKLIIRYMARFGVEQPGQPYREQVKHQISNCDWFLMLLPTAESGRDWPLFEAGYFDRGRGLAGRLVCLHHPDTKVSAALDEKQSVPAVQSSVEGFLKGLFHEPNWVPGMPPINEHLKDLPGKARDIVNLIQPPLQRGSKSCCGPHLEVAFEDGSAVDSWETLAAGRVVDFNEPCKALFDLEVGPTELGLWFKKSGISAPDESVFAELAQAVHAVAEGRKAPMIKGSFRIPDGSLVRPAICAQRRRKPNGVLEGIDILFCEVDKHHDTSRMTPELAALATTLDFAVRFRWEVLDQFIDKELTPTDVVAFNHSLQTIERAALRDKRFSEDEDYGRKLLLSSFEGQERDELEQMYDRWDEMRRADGKGELDQALADMDPVALMTLIKELVSINKYFLTLTSARFSHFIASNAKEAA